MLEHDAKRFAFPPRYAGMEGKIGTDVAANLSFPRATRGWKGMSRCSSFTDRVSPALRGDGRQGRRAELPVFAFPPRYAGMEGVR